MVDPSQVFTGGCQIKIEDSYILGHIALENQPLHNFVEAVLTEKQIKSDFEITFFDPQVGHMSVKLKPLTN